MKKQQNRVSLSGIHKELQDLYYLHKIQQEALWNCYDENKDYGHVFAIDTIYNDKFKNIINKMQYFI